MLKVVLVDDHSIVIEGIKRIIVSDKRYSVVAQLSSGREAIEFARKNTPDIIIMDVSMPDINGNEATLEIKKMKPGIKIIALTMLNDFPSVNKMLECGADGYLIKNIRDAELFTAMELVMGGKIYLSAEIQQVLLRGLQEQKNIPQLTTKEKEVLKYIADGLNNKDIASRLYLSEETIRSHRKNIMSKLNIHNSAELVSYALKNKLG